MFAKYVTTAAPVQAQMIADIAALICGASIASLSASCDKVNSSLVSTIAPGWTLHDAPNSGVVVTAPDVDGLTQKYVRLFAPSASTFDAMGYETWNAVAHTGTNATPGNPASFSFWANQVNTIFIFATARSFYFTSPAAGVGSFEFSRDAGYLQGSSYPCHAIATSASLTSAVSSGNVYVPRMKNLVAAGDRSGFALYAATLAPRYGTGNQGGPAGALYGADGTMHYEIRPMWLMSDGGVIGKLFDVIELARQSGAAFDTFSDGVDTFMLVPSSNFIMIFKVA
jgi:hypothetical protein